MERNNSISDCSRALNNEPPAVVQILFQSLPSKTDNNSEMEFSLIINLLKQGIKEAIADSDQLLDYPELARRLRLGVRATKDLVNCGKITPALRYANVARFHWPSVLQELKKHPLL